MKRTMYIQVNMPIDRFGVHVLSHLLLWHILIRTQEFSVGVCIIEYVGRAILLS